MGTRWCRFWNVTTHTCQPLAGDALIAAGGDGTLAAAARLIASGERPLAILPMGTANNIAKSLAVDGPLDGIVDRWDKTEPRSIDLGFVGGSWGVHRFIESVGAGLVAEGIAEANARKQNGSKQKASVQEGVNGYAETLSTMTPVRTKIEADGEEIDGEFLARRSAEHAADWFEPALCRRCRAG